MKIRNYLNADFDVVAAWWRGHHDNEFQRGFIPPTAYIVTDDKAEPMGFFSMASLQCDFCYFLYPLVRTDVSREQRGEAIDFMIECAKVWAVNTGHKCVYISIRGEKMLSRLEQKGFMSGEKNCQHMFCKVEKAE
jgi:hypothetical protein